MILCESSHAWPYVWTWVEDETRGMQVNVLKLVYF